MKFVYDDDMCCCCISGAFDDEDVTHVEGEVNPVRDLEIIHKEQMSCKCHQVICYCSLVYETC